MESNDPLREPPAKTVKLFPSTGLKPPMSKTIKLTSRVALPVKTRRSCWLPAASPPISRVRVWVESKMKFCRETVAGPLPGLKLSVKRALPVKLPVPLTSPVRLRNAPA